MKNIFLTSILWGLISCSEMVQEPFFTVSFDSDGGTPVQSIVVEAGSIVVAPENPEKQGYEFLFWHLNDTETAYNFETPINYDITLYAKWTESLPALTGTVTITGYAMQGYTLLANVENLNGTGDISYQWKRCDTEDAPGTNITTNGAGSDYTLVEADIDKYIKVTVSRAGYSGSVTSAATEAIAGSPYGDYFGIWRWNYETTWQWYRMTVGADKIVFFDFDGSGYTIEGLTWTEIVNTGSYTDEYPVGYMISGTSSFVGLCISVDKQSMMQASYTKYGEQEYWSAAKGPFFKTSEVTETEYWQITWELNGGEWSYANNVSQAPKDGGITAPAYPRKTGYNFGGWYWDASLTNSITLPYEASLLTGDITLYAKWVKQADIAFVARNPVQEFLYTSSGFFYGCRLNFDLIVYDDAGLTSITISEEATGAPNGNRKTFSQTRVIPISGPGTYHLSQEIVRTETYGNIYSQFTYTVSALGKSYSRNYSGDYLALNGAWSHRFAIN